MNTYAEKRLQELREMTTEEAARCKIRSSTPPRVKAVILRAREKTESGNSTPKHSASRELQDGDVLLKRSSGSITNKIITGVTRSPYTHAALYADGKVYDTLGKAGRAEREGVKLGGNINTAREFFKREKGLTYDVFRPKDRKAAKEAARNAERATRDTKGYSNASLVQAGLRDRFGFGITTNFNKNYRICSELVYDCFNGRIGNDVSSSVSPGRLGKNQHLEKVDTLRLSIEELFKESEDRSKETGEGEQTFTSR